MATMLVTGSSGLIGSEVVRYFSALGWVVHGADNNMRADLFGPEGDTTWNLRELLASCPKFVHHHIDIRNRATCADLITTLKPEVLVHTAAQPSHDLAALRPFDDFDINAGGTLNLLESYRRARCPGTFVHMSTNKVYGDAPNSIALRELNQRWDYADERFANGIPETMPIDQSVHSLFGASKIAADIYVQEFGRYYDMCTMCLRGGCLTGPVIRGSSNMDSSATSRAASWNGRPTESSATRENRSATTFMPSMWRERCTPSSSIRVRARSTTSVAAAPIAVRSWKQSR